MAYIIQITRKWETESSTISEFSISSAQYGELKYGYILERPGCDETTAGRRQRIPEGSYNLKWQDSTDLPWVRQHLPVPWLYNDQVPASRYVYVHNGNYPRNTDGGLLIGSGRATDMVTHSAEALNSFKNFLVRVGIENVQIRIASNYQ